MNIPEDALDQFLKDQKEAQGAIDKNNEILEELFKEWRKYPNGKPIVHEIKKNQMSNIPEDIQSKIIERFYNSFEGEMRITAAEYGYSLALTKIEELEKKVEEQAKEIERLKRENKILTVPIPKQIACKVCGDTPSLMIETDKGWFCKEHYNNHQQPNIQ